MYKGVFDQISPGVWKCRCGDTFRTHTPSKIRCSCSYEHRRAEDTVDDYPCQHRGEHVDTGVRAGCGEHAENIYECAIYHRCSIRRLKQEAGKPVIKKCIGCEMLPLPELPTAGKG